MQYNEMVRTIAKDGDVSVNDRGHLLIREMSKLIDAIMDDEYVDEHYHSNVESVLYDKTMAIKNSMAILEGDLDLYKEVLGITDKVENKKENRIHKIYGRMTQ